MKIPTEKSPQKAQLPSQPSSLQKKEQASFVDTRVEMAQLKASQEMMGTSLQQQQLQALQNKMRAGGQLQLKANNTGLPNNLKSGVESLSGMSMDHVRVHYNSDKPGQLQAHAYAQGSDIHVAPGQEKHLPHEAWHVVQQAQGRVKPTVQMEAGVLVNDDAGLEAEADVVGAKALSISDEQSTQLQVAQLKDNPAVISTINVTTGAPVAQLQIGPAGKVGDGVFHDEFGLGEITAKKGSNYTINWYKGLPPSTISADDPRCNLEVEESAPEIATPAKKSPGQKAHEKAARKKAAEKQQREQAEAQKMVVKRQRGQALWNAEVVRLLALVDPVVKPAQKLAAWKANIARTCSPLKTYLEQGHFPEAASDPELLKGSGDRDNQWKAEVWSIVADKKPKGPLPTRMDLWGFLVGTKMNAGQVHYDPSGAADLHLTVSGNSIEEISTFDKNIFDGSPESIYNELFMKAAIGARVHVTWQGGPSPQRVYVGNVDSLGNNFYSDVWATTPANAGTVANMRSKLDTFKQDMMAKFVDLKMRGWKLPA